MNHGDFVIEKVFKSHYPDSDGYKQTVIIALAIKIQTIKIAIDFYSHEKYLIEPYESTIEYSYFLAKYKDFILETIKPYLNTMRNMTEADQNKIIPATPDKKTLSTLVSLL